MITLKLPQNGEINYTALENAPAGLAACYAFGRAGEKRGEGYRGEDFLAISSNDSRLAFALCDGVGQSFQPAMASSALGSMLVDWMWEHGTALFNVSDNERKVALLQQLSSLTEGAGEQINQSPLPKDVVEIAREALEEYRRQGSESIFICGLVDLAQKCVILAWMGDSRLRLWDSQDEYPCVGDGAFSLRDYWSSRRGAAGQPHFYVASTSELTRLAVYSDGLSVLDKNTSIWQAPNELMAVVNDSLISPADDISFLLLEFTTAPADKTAQAASENQANDPAQSIEKITVVASDPTAPSAQPPGPVETNEPPQTAPSDQVIQQDQTASTAQSTGAVQTTGVAHTRPSAAALQAAHAARNVQPPTVQLDKTPVQSKKTANKLSVTLLSLALAVSCIFNVVLSSVLVYIKFLDQVPPVSTFTSVPPENTSFPPIRTQPPPKSPSAPPATDTPDSASTLPAQDVPQNPGALLPTGNVSPGLPTADASREVTTSP